MICRILGKNQKDYYLSFLKKYLLDGSHSLLKSEQQKNFLIHSFNTILLSERDTIYLNIHQNVFKSFKMAHTQHKTEYLETIKSKIQELGIYSNLFLFLFIFIQFYFYYFYYFFYLLLIIFYFLFFYFYFYFFRHRL